MRDKRTILLVEDALPVRKALRDLLTADGFEVHERGDGAAALDASTTCDFHIIITDYRMPNMNGVDATKHLRKRFPASVIIGVSWDDKRTDFIAAGADAFLLKPFEYDELVQLFELKQDPNPRLGELPALP